jgi:hypothetical protein
MDKLGWAQLDYSSQRSAVMRYENAVFGNLQYKLQLTGLSIRAGCAQRH